MAVASQADWAAPTKAGHHGCAQRLQSGSGQILRRLAAGPCRRGSAGEVAPLQARSICLFTLSQTRTARALFACPSAAFPCSATGGRRGAEPSGRLAPEAGACQPARRPVPRSIDL